MKLIGVEIRVGVRGGPYGRLIEAKLVPLEIDYPDPLLYGFAGQPAANATFHTSDGDVTVDAVFATRGNWDRARQYSDEDVRAALAELERRVARA